MLIHIVKHVIVSKVKFSPSVKDKFLGKQVKWLVQ